MRIKHLRVKNFRSIREFDEDLGQHTLLIGPNNSGKSNLLRAIYCFYNPRNISVDDISRNARGEPLSDVMEICITFDDLNDEERRNNTKYFVDGCLSIILRASLDEDGVLGKPEHHGYIEHIIPNFPAEFPENLRNIWDETSPRRSQVNEITYSGFQDIVTDVKPSGKVTTDAWEEIKNRLLSIHTEIPRRAVLEESPSKYQGFTGASKHDTTGCCLFLEAIQDPSADFQPEKGKTLISQMIQAFLEEIESERAKKHFQKYQEEVSEEQKRKIEDFERDFSRELEEWKTNVKIQIQKKPISEVNPFNYQLIFDDGIPGRIEQKGTGLQRYAFFKLLKFHHARGMGEEKSFIFLFEEPEAHLHPHIQRTIASILRDLSMDDNIYWQTIISTHSPQFIDLLYQDEIFLMRKSRGGFTEINKMELNVKDFKQYIKRAIRFDPRINEILFAKRVILVEGVSEEVIFTYLEQEGELNTQNVSIIKCGGKGEILTFLPVCNHLKIPYTVLIDQDPYIKPHFKSTNRDRLKQKKKAYKKTAEIQTQVNQTIGYLVVIRPDLDKFLGTSGNSLKKKGKMLATYVQIKNLHASGDSKYQDIIKIFQSLIDPDSLFTHRCVYEDGSEWLAETPDPALIPQPTFKSYKRVLTQAKKLGLPPETISETQRKELVNLLFPNRSTEDTD